MSFPTQLTILRMLLAPVFFLLFAVSDPPHYGWATAVFIIAALTDWYDGYFARLWKLTSPLGAFLDPLADKLLTSAALISFAIKGLIPEWTVAVIVGRDVYLTFFRMIADRSGYPIKTSMLAKYKTFFQMIFICYVLLAVTLLSGTLGELSVMSGRAMIDPDVLYWSVFAIAMLTILTAIRYTYDNGQAFLLLFRRYVIKRSSQELS